MSKKGAATDVKDGFFFYYYKKKNNKKNMMLALLLDMWAWQSIWGCNTHSKCTLETFEIASVTHPPTSPLRDRILIIVSASALQRPMLPSCNDNIIDLIRASSLECIHIPLNIVSDKQFANLIILQSDMFTFFIFSFNLVVCSVYWYYKINL